MRWDRPWATARQRTALDRGRAGTPTYKIIRFRFKGEKEVIKTGLTLEEAQAHCEREDTHGDGWFDGYEKE